jgi:hypothetical protein
MTITFVLRPSIRYLLVASSLWLPLRVDAQAAAPAAPTPPIGAVTANPANRSMAGPIAETIGGGLVIGATPVLGLFAAFAAGRSEGCWDDDFGCNDGAGAGWIVGLVGGAAGVALITHGAHRIRQIRKARRRWSPIRCASLNVGREHAGLRLRWTF